jgi:NAD/NADP transhydrogenase alpha subunit
LGISFLVTYIIYYAVVWVIVRRDIDLVWSRANKRLLLASVCAALVVRVLPFTALANLRTPMALILATGAGIASLIMVWREVWGSEAGAKGPVCLLTVFARVKGYD